MLKWKKGSLTLNAQHRPQRNQNNNNRGNSRVGMKTEGLVHNGRPAKWKKAEKQERDEKWRGKNRAESHLVWTMGSTGGCGSLGKVELLLSIWIIIIINNIYKYI